MALTKVILSLLMVGMLTTTWARSITGHREDAEHRDNSIQQFLNKKIRHEIDASSNSDQENKSHDEVVMRKYAKTEAEKFLRKSARIGGKRRRSLHGNEDKVGIPFSARRLEKMLEKAILKIITGDLNTADMIFLKSLNYSLEEVLAIRERELDKKNHFPLSSDVPVKVLNEQKMENDLKEEEPLTDPSRANQLEGDDETTSKKKLKTTTAITSSSLSDKKSSEGDFDFEAYNRQAIYDYENAANKMSSRTLDLDELETNVDYENRSMENPETSDADDLIRKNFDRAMESHVVFKIRYDDSDIDSSSNERAKLLSREKIDRMIPKNHHNNIESNLNSENNTGTSIPSSNHSSTFTDVNTTPSNSAKRTFQSSTINFPSNPVTYRLGNFITPYDDLNTARTLAEPVRAIAIEKNNNSSSEARGNSATTQAFGFANSSSTTPEKKIADSRNPNNKDTSDNGRRKSIYEGLEWVEDDVYRVIPEAMESLNYYDVSANEMENDTTEDSRINGTRSLEIERRSDDVENIANDTIGYQNENPQEEIQTQTESDFSAIRNSPNLNLSAYQQLALAHRRE